MYQQWGVRYLTFVERRFVEQSGGGGDWPALKPATIRSRRTGAGVRTAKTGRKKDGQTKKPAGDAKILRDTGVLLNALSIGAPGNLYKSEKIGIRVGFDKSQKRPDGGVSIGNLAEWHNLGAGNLPARPILVEPNKQTTDGMLRDAEKAVKILIAKYAIPTPSRRSRGGRRP